MIDAIHHVQIAMPPGQEDRARAFYADILRLSERKKPAHLAVRGGCWFEDGSVRIHLGVEEDFHPARKAHPALLVSDLAEVSSRLAAGGFTPVADQPLPGYHRVYVDDPFGNRLELLEELHDLD